MQNTHFPFDTTANVVLFSFQNNEVALKTNMMHICLFYFQVCHTSVHEERKRQTGASISHSSHDYLSTLMCRHKNYQVGNFHLSLDLTMSCEYVPVHFTNGIDNYIINAEPKAND